MTQSALYHAQRIAAAESQLEEQLELWKREGFNEFAQINCLRRVAYAASFLADCLQEHVVEDGRIE